MAAKKAEGKPAAAGKGNAPKKASTKAPAAAVSKPKQQAQPAQAESVKKSADVRKKGAPVREM